MQKIQDLAKVLRVYIDDALEQSNATNKNGLYTARMEFCYSSGNGESESGADSDAMEFLGKVKGGNTFNVLLNLNRADAPKGTDLLALAKSKLEGKSIFMTTYVIKIDELTNGKILSVHNPNTLRVYSSLNNSFVGRYNDDKNVFETMKNRLKSDIASGDLVVGEPEVESPEKKDNKLDF